MASTDLITYLNYMSTWDTESDANIDRVIAEQNLLLKIDQFESDSVVEEEFAMLIGKAMEVRDHTIAEDALQIAADAAAVASIWSLGLGMAAFAAAEAAALIEKGVISSKSNALNEKLATIDTDISAAINEDVKSYVATYKANNNFIAAKAPKGLDTSTCRSILMQFMADVRRKTDKLDATVFRQYAESARKIFNSQEINKVYDALDELNLSAKSSKDVEAFMNVLVGFRLPGAARISTGIVRGVSIAIMFNKLRIATNTIKTQAQAAGIPVEEVNASAFKAMDAVGKFAAAVAVLMSVVDIFFTILDIVNVVEQCRKMCDELAGDIKANYKAYFNGIREASRAYKKAILPSKNNWKEISSHQPTHPWSDKRGWGSEKYYSTIQTVGVKDELYLIGRAGAGIDTYRLVGDKWAPIAGEWNYAPKWSDQAGWNLSSCYSTIQTAVVNDELYLVGRSSDGLNTYKLVENRWKEISVKQPTHPWSDRRGWSSEKYYSTIQTVGVKDKLYLIGRAGAGIDTYRLAGDKWAPIAGEWNYAPKWSDTKGWNAPGCYSTIQTAVVSDELYLIGRSSEGIDTYQLVGNRWHEVSLHQPTHPWSDKRGWGSQEYYSTIQTAVVNNELYLLGRAEAGIDTYKLVGHQWVSVTGQWNYSPKWSDKRGWDNPMYYATIQTAVVNDELYLLGRSADGMDTYKLVDNRWVEMAMDQPVWSDREGWDDPSCYTTIQTAVVNDALYLLGRGTDGVQTFKLTES